MEEMACDLEAARITTLPADSFYISDFVSEDEEAWLLQKVSVICDSLAWVTGYMHGWPIYYDLSACS